MVQEEKSHETPAFPGNFEANCLVIGTVYPVKKAMFWFLILRETLNPN